METNELKREFLIDEFTWLSIQAAIQRSKPYLKGIDDLQKATFRSFIKSRIIDIGKEYVCLIEESTHEGNLMMLTNEITERYRNILKDNRFRIGVTQKVINLYLKYLWCGDKITMPPHCPFDRNIIELLPKEFRMNWTEIDKIEDYRKLVAAAKKEAGSEPLAEWELRKFHEVMKTGLNN
jgi:hypothetical protein